MINISSMQYLHILFDIFLLTNMSLQLSFRLSTSYFNIFLLHICVNQYVSVNNVSPAYDLQ